MKTAQIGKRRSDTFSSMDFTKNFGVKKKIQTGGLYSFLTHFSFTWTDQEQIKFSKKGQSFVVIEEVVSGWDPVR